VYSRSHANAERFAHEHAGASPVPIEVVTSSEAAVRDADLVCTTTSAREPLVRGRWLRAGAHVNAVGACFPATRELDTEAVRMARFYTDCRESCVHEAGDYLLPLAEGAIDESHLLGELGESPEGSAAHAGDDDLRVSHRAARGPRAAHIHARPAPGPVRLE
jgi:ornithine cyclodeaminase